MNLVMAILISPYLMAQSISFDRSKWLELEFNKIPSNKVEYAEKAIKIHVQSSASPLVYKFDNLQEVNQFEVDLQITGEMEDSEGGTFEEDSYFRLGLVVVGDNLLGVAGKLFAPQWVKQLFSLAPEGVGLDKIYFYNLGKNKDFLNKERQHPQSKYMQETIVGVKGAKSSFLFGHSLPKAFKTAAVWISVDGDNTKSKFSTEIKSIILK